MLTNSHSPCPHGRAVEVPRAKQRAHGDASFQFAPHPMPAAARQRLHLSDAYGGGVRAILLALSLLVLLTSTAGAAESEDSEEEGASRQAETASLQSEVALPLDAATTHGIKMMPATKRALVETLTAFARVAYDPNAVAHVGAPVEGRVIELPHGLGDQVAKGAELLVLESPQLAEAQGDLLQKRTAVVSAKTGVEIGQLAFERAKTLVQRNGTSVAEYQRAAGELRKAQGELQAADTGVVASESKLRLLGFTDADLKALATSSSAISSRFRIRSPIAGRVTERQVALGEVVDAGREDLVVVTDTSRMWVLADVPDHRLREMRPGAQVRIRVPAVSDSAFAGKVSSIAPATNPALRTGEVRVEVPNPDGSLRAGMFAQCEIETVLLKPGEKPVEVLAVPDQAVVNLGGITAVFVGVEDEPDSFARRRVKVGKRVGNWVPVLEGLKEGEEVVTTGTFILKAELGRANVKE